MNEVDISGTWQSWYEYESGGVTHDSAHTLHLVQQGNTVTGSSQPKTTGDSSVELNLAVHDREVRGQFREVTEQRGRYAGREFTGLIHLALNADNTEMRGVWTGASRSGVIKSGAWILRRAGVIKPAKSG
jgi:hypothetical protein